MAEFKLYPDLIYELAFLNKFSSVRGEVKDSNLVEFKSCKHLINFSCILINSYIKKINLNCKGCILFKAISNAICLEIEDKTKLEAIEIIKKFLDMLEGKYSENQIEEKNIKLFWKFRFSKTRKSCLNSGPKEILNFLLTL